VIEREEGGIRRLSRSQVGEIRVSVSRERDFVRGARLGLVAVAPWLALGTLVSLVFPPEVGPGDTFLMVVGGVVVAGAVLGGITRQDLWVEASWPGTEAPLPTDSLGAEER
jgi:hypothetical protein